MNNHERLERLSEAYGVPGLLLSQLPIDEDALALIPSEIAHRAQVIPVSRAGATLVVAMLNPADLFTIDELKLITGFEIEVCVTTQAELERALEVYYGDAPATPEEAEAPVEGPIIRLVNLILIDAVKARATEVHIDPYEDALSVRYRVDGALYEVMTPPCKLRGVISARLKVIGGLDIAERRLPQGGLITLRLKDSDPLSFRVSTMPTISGEKFMLRLVDPSDAPRTLEALGMSATQLRMYHEALHARRGVVLFTGPSRAGKKSSLYATLSSLQAPDLNIMTMEYATRGALEGVQQSVAHEEIGLDFAAHLRASFDLRPDVIMVDELRGSEEAELAMRRALRGSLVLSTLHTHDSVSGLTRLQNMGLEPALIVEALRLIIAQRLGRRLCEGCKARVEIAPEALSRCGLGEAEIGGLIAYGPVGCPACGGRGYVGRVAFFEALPIGEELQALSLAGADPARLKAAALRLGMRTLRRSALDRFKEGLTSLEEVLLHTPPD